MILSPFDSIRAKHRDFIESTKWLRTTMSVLSHSLCRNISNSWRFVAFRFSTRRLMIDHRFSTGLTSGLFHGQSITSGTSFDKNCCATRLLCLESLSCWRRQCRPNCFLALRITEKNFRWIINPQKGFITEKSVYQQALPFDKPFFLGKMDKGLSPVANRYTLVLVSLLINPFSIDPHNQP